MENTRFYFIFFPRKQLNGSFAARASFSLSAGLGNFLREDHDGRSATHEGRHHLPAGRVASQLGWAMIGGGMLMVAYGGIVRDEVCVMGFIGIFCVFTVQYVFISSPWWPWQFGSYSLLVDCTNPEGNPGWWVIHLFEPVVGHFRS